MSSIFSFTRRKVLKDALVLAAMTSCAKALTWSTNAMAQATKKLIDMSGKATDAANVTALKIAQGLGYVENAKASDKAGKLKRKTDPKIASKNMICYTCNFYLKEVEKGKSGECALIPGVLVHHGAYCNTWVRKGSLSDEEIKKHE